ncbi:MAG: hypothetical protein K2F79_04785, partial [Muribaculaceae bacterium]|nr:hypothetical protein [Muribaculaceae bacterium]
MKNRIIYPTFAVALALAGATAMAGINGFERKNYEKAPVLTRHQQTPLNLRQPSLNYNAASPEMLSAKSEDTPKVIFSNEPVNNAASYTTDCYTGNKWQGANIMDRNDGNVWINCVTDNQARASVGLQDDWIWFPADITIPNATLSFSGKVSNQYNNAHQNFEILLCSEESKDAVIGTFLVYDNFDVPEGSRSPYRNYFQAIDGECKGPSAPGRYYLAIHVKGSDPSNKYSYSMLNFGALTLTEVSTEPELGPNGEIFEIHPTEAEFNASTVIDANNDGHTITYYAHQSEIDGKYFDWPIFYENSYTDNDADEWFITTGVDIRRPDLKHTVSVEAMALATGSTEAFEIAIGTQPDIESMTKIIMNQPGVGNNKGEFTKFTSNFAVPQEGIY